ncbi:MAG: ComEC/Rec2 family competence protein [Candidatus Omnitrophota bacterium]
MKSHRPLFSVTLCLSLGILLDPVCPLSFKTLLTLILLTLCASLIAINKKSVSSIFLLTSIILLGLAASFQYQYLSKDHIDHVAKYYRSTTVELEGVVVSELREQNFFQGKKTSFELDVKRFKTRWGWRVKSGKILVQLFRQDNISYGDDLILEGKLHRPFDFSDDSPFSYRDYLSRRQIKLILSVKKDGVLRRVGSNQGHMFKELSLRVKDKLKSILKNQLTPHESGLMQAILLGDRWDIPQHIRELFIQTGTAHILAISGLHIGIIAFLIFVVLKMMPLPRKARYVLTVVFLSCYAFLTGGRASVIRATIMANVFLLSFLVERETEPVNSLSLAALILLMFNPLNLFDVGFQLSFISVFSIIFFYPRFFRTVSNGRLNLKNRWILLSVQSLIVSVSAWLGVAGLIAYHFHIITPITVLANFLIIPFVTLIVALGLGLLMAGVLLPQVGFIFAICVKLILNLAVMIIYLMSRLPGAYINLQHVSFWPVLLYYAVIFLLPFGVPFLVKLTLRRP